MSSNYDQQLGLIAATRNRTIQTIVLRALVNDLSIVNQSRGFVTVFINNLEELHAAEYQLITFHHLCRYRLRRDSKSLGTCATVARTNC